MAAAKQSAARTPPPHAPPAFTRARAPPCASPTLVRVEWVVWGVGGESIALLVRMEASQEIGNVRECQGNVAV